MTLKIDAKGRITVGPYLPKGTSSVQVKTDDEGNVTLIPFVEIPVREAWLYKNPEALRSLMDGIKQADSGQTREFDPSALPDLGEDEDA